MSLAQRVGKKTLADVHWTARVWSVQFRRLEISMESLFGELVECFIGMLRQCRKLYELFVLEP